MSLEDLTGTSKFIDALVVTNPIGADGLSEADNHIKGIKNVLFNTFPNITGAVTATETHLNNIDGLTVDLSGLTSTAAELNILDGCTATAAELNYLTDLAGGGTKLDAFATSTAAIFAQASAPIGWTQDTSKTDHMLRLVSGVGGGSGGSDSPILMDKVPSHTHGTNDPGTHTHSLPAANNLDVGTTHLRKVPSTSATTDYTGMLGAGSHTHTTNSQLPVSANWTPKYVDTIICTKDA